VSLTKYRRPASIACLRFPGILNSQEEQPSCCGCQVRRKEPKAQWKVVWFVSGEKNRFTAPYWRPRERGIRSSCVPGLKRVRWS
jgi:hypothetical protein